MIGQTTNYRRVIKEMKAQKDLEERKNGSVSGDSNLSSPSSFISKGDGRHTKENILDSTTIKNSFLVAKRRGSRKLGTIKIPCASLITGVEKGKSVPISADKGIHTYNFLIRGC